MAVSSAIVVPPFAQIDTYPANSPSCQGLFPPGEECTSSSAGSGQDYLYSEADPYYNCDACSGTVRYYTYGYFDDGTNNGVASGRSGASLYITSGTTFYAIFYYRFKVSVSTQAYGTYTSYAQVALEDYVYRPDGTHYNDVVTLAQGQDGSSGSAISCDGGVPNTYCLAYLPEYASETGTYNLGLGFGTETDGGYDHFGGTVAIADGGAIQGSNNYITIAGIQLSTVKPGTTGYAPSISTSLQSGSIVAGQSVYDTSTLSGVTSGAGGSASYYWFSGGSCSGSATLAGTVTVTNGVVPNSPAVKFSSIGSYSWEAVYSGDVNNNQAISSCEPLTVNANSWSITLTASSTSLQVGQTVTLTATANQGFSAGSGYYINIWDQTAGSYTICNSGPSCPAAESQSSPTTHTFEACVDTSSGTCSGALATSSKVSVTWSSSTANPSISITQSGTTLYWHISGLTPSGSFTVSESTSQGFTDSFGPYTASSSGTDTRAFNYGGGTSGDVVSLTVTDSSSGKTASTSYTVQSSSSLTISITQSGSTLYWHISGLTPSGSFTVSESTSQGFTDSFGPYTASSSGTDSRAFNYGGGTSGDVIHLTVTDSSTGNTASTSYTIP